MKNFFLALVLFLVPSLASAQCTGVFPANYVCGTVLSGAPHAVPSSSFGGITGLTGDGTATGPGVVPLTLSTVNSNVGTFGGAAGIPQFTVNGKGLITAASNVAPSSRTILIANRTYYVNPNSGSSSPCGAFTCSAGSDSNTGLSNTSPWLTLQHAQNVINQSVDLAGFIATVQLADGTFTTAGTTLNVNGPYIGSAPAASNYPNPATCPVLFKGNTATNINVVVTGSSGASTVIVADGAYVCFQDMQMTSTGGGSGLQLGGSTISLIGNIDFAGNATPVRAGIWSANNSVVENYSDISFHGNFVSAIEASYSSVANIFTNTLNITADMAVTQFVKSDRGGRGVFDGLTIALNGHTVIGKRFTITNGSSIATGNSCGAAVFPGTIQGTIDFGSALDSCQVITATAGVKLDGAAFASAIPPNTVWAMRGADGSEAVVSLAASGSGSFPQWNSRFSRGTSAVQTAAQTGDFLGILNATGYGATGYNATNTTGGIGIYAAQNFTDSAMGTGIGFYTTPLNSTTQANVWNIGPSGSLWSPLATGTDCLASGCINAHGSIKVDNVNVLTGMTLTGDVTGSGAASVATTYNNVVPSTKGGAGIINGALKGNGSGVVSQAACADLSDGGNGGCALTYAQGTWTPTLFGSGTAGIPTYVTQVGSYERIGRQWQARFSIQTSAISGAVGNMQIGGLPWTQANTTSDYGQCFILDMIGVTLTASYTVLTGFIQPNAALVQLFENGSGQSGQAAAVSKFASGSTLLVIGICFGHN